MNNGNEDFNDISEEYLKQNDWWWRRLVFGHYHDNTKKPNPYHVTKPKIIELISNGFKRNDQVRSWLENNLWIDWRDKLELPTYRYEMARRVLRLKKKKLPHWPLLNEIEELVLIGMLGEKKDERRLIHIPNIFFIGSNASSNPVKSNTAVMSDCDC